MKLIKSSETIPYEAKAHFNCWSALKITPDTGSKKIDIRYSHFLPNGGAEMSSSPAERVYFLLEGNLIVKGPNEEHHLSPGDMIYIAPGEDRAIEVENNRPATTLVVIGKID
jgi:glyoxylate utilization-related uncharacterized protein